MERNNRVAPRVNLMNFKYYTFYRGKKKSIPKKYHIKDRTELFRITSAICKKVADNITEKEGGVLMDGLGYFTIWMNPRKQVYTADREGGKKKTMINYHTDGYIYHPEFFAHINPRSPLRYWTMDRTFNRNINRTLAKKLRQGVKYKFYYNIVRRIYSKSHLLQD